MRKYSNETLEQAVGREVLINYGKRYLGATLSSSCLPSWSQTKIIDYMGKPSNFLVICGGVGISKTYTCASLTEWILKNFNTSRYWNERGLQEALQNSWSSTSGNILKYLIDDDLVILDDIGSEGFSDWKEKILMETIDQRYNSMLPTIFISNLFKSDFEDKYHARIASRLFATENTIIEIFDAVDQRTLGK